MHHATVEVAGHKTNRRYKSRMKKEPLIGPIFITPERDPNILFALVFGSRDRGDAHPRSNLDLAIQFAEQYPIEYKKGPERVPFFISRWEAINRPRRCCPDRS